MHQSMINNGEMNFDPDAPIAQTQIGARVTVSKSGLEPEVAIRRMKSMIRARLSEQLAATLSNSAIIHTAGKYSDEYEVRVYVLTSDQLERLVQERARCSGSPMNDIML